MPFRPEPQFSETPPRMEENPSSTGNPVLDFFLHYWHEKRGDYAMPPRAAIDAREFKQHLGWVCLLDALPDYVDFRYRLVRDRASRTSSSTTEPARRYWRPSTAPDRALGEAALWVYRKCLPCAAAGAQHVAGRRLAPSLCAPHRGPRFAPRTRRRNGRQGIRTFSPSTMRSTARRYRFISLKRSA